MKLIKDWEGYKAKCMSCDICRKEHLFGNHTYPLFHPQMKILPPFVWQVISFIVLVGIILKFNSTTL